MQTLILAAKNDYFNHLLRYCILLEIDFQTHVSGYPNTFLWISKHVFGSVLYRVSGGIHVTQMRPRHWLITLCIINKFEK